ncbi:AMP-binding protein [Paenibacillus sp. GCM10012306]|uniref:AMP-binding protein n=1 Tax=Paenibacillus sp. GCM10012306 TaxID=3317342 RepID=UPI00360F2F43
MNEILKIADILDGADTIPELLSNAVGRFQQQTAVKFKANGAIIEKTYVQLKADSDALSAAFEERGLAQINIGIIGDLSYEWMVTFFGVTGSGNTVVPIDKDLSLLNIERLILQADVVVLFVDGNRLYIAEELRQRCESLKVIVCFDNTERFQSLDEFSWERASKQPMAIRVHADHTAMIVFTSSAAGDHKGAMLSHRNLCHDVLCSVYLVGRGAFTPGECTVPVLPPHHMFAITPGILAPMLFYGITVCIGGGLNNYLKSVKQFSPAMLIMVPMIVEGIYKRILREAKKNGKENREVLNMLGGELRTIICGGAYMDAELVDKFQALGITLLNGYGITECSPVVSCNRPGSIRKNSVGLVAPEPYCQVKINNGEIMVRGSIVMQGYYKDQRGTQEAFEEGWFKTGDLGYTDKDNYLYITGRKKDLIILKDGNNISPVEIEQAIEEHPLIDRSLVYAADKNGTEMLMAVIYPDYKYADNNGIDDVEAALNEVIHTINKSSPAFKRIRRVEVHEKAFDKQDMKKERRVFTTISKELATYEQGTE